MTKHKAAGAASPFPPWKRSRGSSPPPSAPKTSKTTKRGCKKDSGSASSSSSQEQPPAVTVTPTEHDVLLGRGKRTSDWPGNVHFRQVVNVHRDAYTGAVERLVKTKVGQAVLSAIQKRGRFLMQSSKKGGWVVAPHERALEKCCQALREKETPRHLLAAVATPQWATVKACSSDKEDLAGDDAENVSAAKAESQPAKKTTKRGGRRTSNLVVGELPENKETLADTYLEASPSADSIGDLESLERQEHDDAKAERESKNRARKKRGGGRQTRVVVGDLVVGERSDNKEILAGSADDGKDETTDHDEEEEQSASFGDDDEEGNCAENTAARTAAEKLSASPPPPLPLERIRALPADEMIERLERFIAATGHAGVPPLFEPDEQLAEWCSWQRQVHRQVVVTQYRPAADAAEQAGLDRLQALDFVWDYAEWHWQSHCDKCLQQQEQRRAFSDDCGAWLQDQRRQRGQALTKDCRQKLARIHTAQL